MAELVDSRQLLNLGIVEDDKGVFEIWQFVEADRTSYGILRLFYENCQSG